MRNKRQKWICVLITLFVFLAGMCFEDIQAGSEFICAPALAEASFISAADTFITDAQACTAEMLGIRGNTRLEQSTIRFANRGRDTKISLDFLWQTLFSINEEQSDTGFEGIQFACRFRNELVINYIHKSDGKKRG